jgi:hypothetical protein
MALEWVRRQDPALDAQLRQYLFTTGPIVSVEDDADPESAPEPRGVGLAIGSLRSRS